MQALPSQTFLLDLCQGASSLGTSSVPFMHHAAVELVNNSSIALNGSTTWGSVSPYLGGYDGYGASSITWNAPGVNQAGAVEVTGSTSIFRPTDSVAPQNMFGLVLRDPLSSVVLAAGPFDAPPIPMASALNSIQVTLSYQPATNNIVCTVVS